MQKHKVQARKRALKYLCLPENSDLPYSVIALEVAAKDRSVVLDANLDLTNKRSAAAFLAVWRPR